jgi:hypothetical protein
VLVREDLVGPLDEGVGYLRALAGLGGVVGRLDRERVEAGALGVRVRQRTRETLAAEDRDGPVLLLVHDEALDPVEVHVLVQKPYQLLALLGGDAAGPAVGDLALLVLGGEVNAGGEVVLAEVEADAQSAEHAAADLEAQRVVAEEGKVAWPAAGAHPCGDGAREAEVRARGEGVQVRGVGGLKLRLVLAARGVHRQTAQTVNDEQHDLRVRLDRQLAHEVEIQNGFLSLGLFLFRRAPEV